MKRIVPVLAGVALCGWFALELVRSDGGAGGAPRLELPAEEQNDRLTATAAGDTESAPTSAAPESPVSVHGSVAKPGTPGAASPNAAASQGIAATFESVSTPISRRLQSARVLESRETRSADGRSISRQHLLEATGKYPYVVVDQTFAAGSKPAADQLKAEVAYAADAVLLRAKDATALKELAARGEIRSFRKISRDIYRIRLPRAALNSVAEATARLGAAGSELTSIEPDYLVFTGEAPTRRSDVDRDADGQLDEELTGPGALDLPVESHPTLSPELVMADVEQRLANAPLGARVLTFDLPLTDARPQVAYRPYLMEQNFLLIAPNQSSSIYPQPPYNAGYPSNGTIYVRSLSSDAGIQIRHKDRLPFSIHSIDLSEYSTVTWASSVNFVGYRKDGTTVSQSFRLDGRIDGTGPLADFETFAFSSQFTNLDRVVITNNGFMMDNLVVIPAGEETPLPPPPDLPVLYDITWDGFPHTTGAVTEVGGGYAPSTINFGSPRVVSQVGPMPGPALELRDTGSTYEQFTCLLERGGTSYTAEFDMVFQAGGSLALFFDRISNLCRIDFYADGRIISTFGFSGTFSSRVVNRFRFEADIKNGLCKIFKNGTLMYSGAFPSQSMMGDVRDVRLSASLNSGDVIGIDNLRITGVISENPTTGPRALIRPAALSFPPISAGMISTRGVQIQNTGSEPLVVTGARTASSHFRIDRPRDLTLPPGYSETVDVTFAPTTAGAHTGTLLFETNENGATTHQVPLSGTASGEPAVHLTPSTLHVTMLAEAVGTEYFTIHNTGFGALQWHFISQAPPSPVSPITPNDSQFQSLWGLKSPGVNRGGIDAARAWSAITDASRVPVAVIDTGVDYNHQDLTGSIRLNSSEVPGNGIDDDQNGFIDDHRGWNFYADNADAMDDSGHGTHVSGTIGATGHNGLGVTGVAWKAAIVPIKFLGAQGFGYTSDAIAAIDYATGSGCRVINASWGGSGYSTLLRDVIEFFTEENDGLFVAAAGNSFLSIDQYPSFPASYDVNGIIAVAASDPFDTLASFSNWGATVDIAAPGQSILSCAPGNKYALASGTSMAAPHVTGSVALLFSYHSGLTSSECFQRLLASADFPAGISGKVRTGSRLNLNSALLSTVVPWIRPAVWSGTVPPNSHVRVPLSVDTHGMQPGDYEASLALQTNDPQNLEIGISARLKVKERHRFNQWSAEQFGVNNLLFESNASQMWAASADPDGDGSSNLLEFLTGADPSTPSLLPISGQTDGTGNRLFRYEIRREHGGVQYRVEWTDDLASGNWAIEGIHTRHVEFDAIRQVDLWESHLPAGAQSDSLFFRIVAGEN